MMNVTPFNSATATAHLVYPALLPRLSKPVQFQSMNKRLMDAAVNIGRPKQRNIQTPSVTWIVKKGFLCRLRTQNTTASHSNLPNLFWVADDGCHNYLQRQGFLATIIRTHIAPESEQSNPLLSILPSTHPCLTRCCRIPRPACNVAEASKLQSVVCIDRNCIDPWTPRKLSTSIKSLTKVGAV